MDICNKTSDRMLAFDMYSGIKTADNVKALVAMVLFIVDNSVEKCSFCPCQIAAFTRQNNPCQSVQDTFMNKNITWRLYSHIHACTRTYRVESVSSLVEFKGGSSSISVK